MIRRRDFLRATLITASALVLPACSSDPDPATPGRTLTDGSASFPQSVASGDPKPESVVLWTRVEDKDAASADLDLELEVATDEGFTKLLSLDAGKAKLKALARYDHCAKVKLAGLSAATTYYYRFIYVKGDKNLVSHVGRTKTAPAADADVAVKFAFVSCQDYIGRFYNAYLLIAQEDLDFVVHLGDYVYETTGDPSFQNTSGRSVTFADEKGAIALDAKGQVYHAAKSLSNYRDLYKTYRSDGNLQKVHELFPMIVTWDDHEFSDDSYGATATYFDGKKDETDVDRRKAANQAWFEYQPVDYHASEDFQYDPAAAFPGDIEIYRDFVFGKNVHLVMTDLRSHRADHLIPEDAFPGAIALDQAALTAELGAVPAFAGPYIDVETFLGGAYKTSLAGVAMAAGFDTAKITGKISVAFINALGAKLNPSLPMAQQILPIDEAAQAGLEKGLAFQSIGKAGFYSSIGSRYLVVKDTFDLYARVRNKATSGAAQEVMGKDQETWFLDTMAGSKATWKVWGNEYCLSQLAIDLSMLPVPDGFKHSFYMDADDWDGFRDRRSSLLEKLAPIGGVVAVTGDIHAFFAGTPSVNGDPSKKIVEIVGSSISSTTYKSLLKSQVASDPVLSTVPGAASLAGAIDSLLTSKDTKINPLLGYANSGANGYVTVEASSAELLATMHIFPELTTKTDYTSKLPDLLKLVSTAKFRAIPSDSELYMQIDGAWKKWDPTTFAYV
jgi:alkaline phosphatase D